jgi:predicted HicB family RNase H-like nuclease
MLEYRGYAGIVEFDPDLDLFAGHVIDLRDTIYFEGRSVTELKTSLWRAVDTYLEMCAEDGRDPDRPYSGKFVVRVPSELHRALAAAAASEHVSLNAFVEKRFREIVA